jgi:hypothetical protein
LYNNDLPGPVEAAFEKAGVKLSPATNVVYESSSDYINPYWITALVAGGAGFSLMLGGALSLAVAPLRRKRLGVVNGRRA